MRAIERWSRACAYRFDASRFLTGSMLRPSLELKPENPSFRSRLRRLPVQLFDLSSSPIARHDEYSLTEILRRERFRYRRVCRRWGRDANVTASSITLPVLPDNRVIRRTSRIASLLRVSATSNV